MATPDIKAGKYYNLKMLCVLKRNKFIAFETPSGVFISLNQRDLECVSPIPHPEPPTLVGTTPKHVPCRKFRKGDKVRLIKWNGRTPFDTLHGLKLNPGEVHIVLDDEYERNEVYIGMSAADEEQSVVHACNLELITPVEELEPYKVNHVKELELFEVCHYEMGDDTIEKEGELNKIVRTIYWYGKRKLDRTEEEAKAEAEAERDRLNAEHRKEQV